MTNNTDWQERFSSDAQMQQRPAGAALRTLERDASANLAEQEDLAAWIDAQEEVIGRARAHLTHLRAVHTDLMRAVDALY
jgi:hypothetical protein